jgi:Na+-driven multidrug efflux pump
VFTSDPAVVPIAVQALRFLSYGYVSYAYGMVVTAAFNGAGDTITPTILNIICFWACQIPVAYVLSFHTSLGVRGTYVAIVVSDSLLALTGVIWFRRGKWKQRVV